VSCDQPDRLRRKLDDTVHKARIIIIGTTAALAVGLAATPAFAAPNDGTIVTFAVEGGTLDIDAPATADLGGGGPDSVITGAMGPVTVTDGRAAADASWLASVTTTNFTTGASTPTETIAAALVDYWSGPATATTGTGTFGPGQALAAGAAALTLTPALLTAFTHTGGTGNNTCTWNPTLDINVPLSNQAGTYTGTVTHSVA
jgi:hypothetical protein